MLKLATWSKVNGIGSGVVCLFVFLWQTPLFFGQKIPVNVINLFYSLYIAGLPPK